MTCGWVGAGRAVPRAPEPLKRAVAAESHGAAPLGPVAQFPAPLGVLHGAAPLGLGAQFLAPPGALHGAVCAWGGRAVPRVPSGCPGRGASVWGARGEHG
ncbi:hypothetical protein GCM10010243_62800 [Streptomyces matensis]|nr:hypothetical protein GCM10010243_62800 [Streptomyces matensis]